MVLRRSKQLLTNIGARLSANALHQMQMVVNYMKLGRWMEKNNFRPERRVPDRYGVFGAVIEQVRDKQVLYLEFGVFQGTCTRFWSKSLKHPDTQLHGFDSFEGLPEDFDVDGPYVKGTFDVGGQIPQIDDPRVQFHKGWFDQVLPTFELPEHEVLVIIIDADLYSSTQYVLHHLRPAIKPGTFIYFDDMSRPDHEPRAFEEFMKAHRMKFRLVATEASLNTAFFECVE